MRFLPTVGMTWLKAVKGREIEGIWLRQIPSISPLFDYIRPSFRSRAERDKESHYQTKIIHLAF